MTTEDFNFLLTAHQKNTLKTPNSFLKVAGLVAGLGVGGWAGGWAGGWVGGWARRPGTLRRQGTLDNRLNQNGVDKLYFGIFDA